MAAAGRSGACCVLVAFLMVWRAAQGQLVIRRNAQDCVYPAIEADHFPLWPTRAYLPIASAVRAISGGGFRVDSAAGFSIEYYKTYKIITNKIASEQYVVYSCGTGKPAPGTKVFQGPLMSVSVNDGGAADYMAQQLLLDRVAFTTDLSVSGCLQAIAGCGYLAPDTYNNEDLDKIKGRVDAYMTYAATPNPQTIAFSAPAAKSPLERAKWLQYVAAFFNKEDVANTLYAAIRDAYNALKRAVKDLKAADASVPTPRMCWVYQDWEGDFAMSFANYKMAYVTDAGGQMYDPADLTGAGMVPKPADSTTTYVYKAGSDNVAAKWAGVLSLCDIIIDESYKQATGGLTLMADFLDVHGVADYADQIPAVVAALVYSIAGTTGMTVTTPGSFNLGSVGLDWFERGTCRADEVLRDFVKVITPQLTLPELTSWSLRWLLRLDGQQQQQRIAAVCNQPTAKLNANCRRTNFATRICPTAIRNCDTGVVEYPATAVRRCMAVSNQDRARRLRKRQGLPECAPEQLAP